MWVALLADAADNEQSFVSRIASKKNLGDDDKQTEDDETSTDLEDYTCVEMIWRQRGDDADSSMLECRHTGENISRHAQILNNKNYCSILKVPQEVPISREKHVVSTGLCL